MLILSHYSNHMGYDTYRFKIAALHQTYRVKENLKLPDICLGFLFFIPYSHQSCWLEHPFIFQNNMRYMTESINRKSL